MSGRPEVSIILCTRNRCDLLPATCEALLELDHGGPPWELVLVDNGSTDDTRAVASRLRRRFGGALRIVQEPTVGLSAARNAGVRSARGRILAFLDDDARPDGRWVEALVAALDDNQAYAVGGPVEPRYRSSLPPWFSDQFLPYLTVWDRGDTPVPLHYNEYPRGANMAFRREAFERFGEFSTHLGRKAESLLSCEEIEFCLRIERGEGLILYTPEARVAHIVEGERVTRDWLVRRFRAQGTSEAILEWQHLGWSGLAIGLRRSLRGVLSPGARRDQSGGELLRRCDLATLWGYAIGAVTSPGRVPRYTPTAEAGPPVSWRPFE